MNLIMKFGKAVLCARCVLWFTGMLLVLMLGACATYQSPDLPANQLATIEIDSNTHTLRFLSVDAVYLSAIGGLNSFVGRDPLKLRPGKRAISVQFVDGIRRPMNESGVLLVFDAQPGGRYIVRERLDGNRIYVWVTTDKGQNVPLLNTP